MLGLRLSAQIGLHMEPHMELHRELHMGLHMELHMELHMRLHMELHMGSIWRPIWADRRSPSMLISLHQNKIETAIYIYICAGILSTTRAALAASQRH